MTFGETYDAIFDCLNGNLATQGIDVFEAEGGGIGLIGTRDLEAESRPVYLLQLHTAKVEVNDGS